jgi:nucleotide-binding universal stress UspA family protein
MGAPVVVVGVDGSERSVHALVAAVRLAAVTDSRIVAVHVVHDHSLAAAAAAPVSGAGALAVSDDELTDRCHMDCELVLAGTHVDWQFEVRRGAPVTELVKAAADHDAICVTVGRSPRRRFICGSRSTMEQLAHRCDRPVLIVPSQT